MAYCGACGSERTRHGRRGLPAWTRRIRRTARILHALRIPTRPSHPKTVARRVALRHVKQHSAQQRSASDFVNCSREEEEEAEGEEEEEEEEGQGEEEEEEQEEHKDKE